MNGTSNSFTLQDLTLDHVGALTEIVSHPDFFYPYINENNKNPAVEALNYCRLAERTRHAKNRSDWIKGVFNDNTDLLGVCVLVGAQPIYSDMPEQGLVAEIGYFIRAEDQNKKYGTRTAHMMAAWGHAQHNICALWATVDPDFKASQKILNGLGLTQTDYIPEGKYTDRHGNPRPRLKFEGRIT